MGKVIIIMGSKSDLAHCGKIASAVQQFGIPCEMRIASAHKVPLKTLEILKKTSTSSTVFITCAGRSNALSGLADAQTPCPVISCPPNPDSFAGADIWSSIRMPTGVAPLLVLDPENAALAAIKILAVADNSLRAKVEEYQEKKRLELEEADLEIKKQTEH